MTDFIKICGLKTAEAVDAAVTGGATHLGFVFFDPSPRNIAPAQAAGLKPQKAQTVGLFVDPTDDDLAQVLDQVKLDMVQLHGAESPARVAAVKAGTGLPVIKALPIATKSDLGQIDTYGDVADLLLFDAKPPKTRASLTGGMGQTFDWTLLEGIKTPYVLAGGLTPDNVAGAIAQLHPFGVDVSSGVESSRGVKDPDRIAAFLAAVKE